MTVTCSRRGADAEPGSCLARPFIIGTTAVITKTEFIPGCNRVVVRGEHILATAGAHGRYALASLKFLGGGSWRARRSSPISSRRPSLIPLYARSRTGRTTAAYGLIFSYPPSPASSTGYHGLLGRSESGRGGDDDGATARPSGGSSCVADPASAPPPLAFTQSWKSPYSLSSSPARLRTLRWAAEHHHGGLYGWGY